MDITLIPESEKKLNKKLRKNFISDEGMVILTDCTVLLLHKSGMRPLYLMTDNGESILLQPNHKKMAPPDLILYSDAETSGEQSAKVIQEQLKTCDCSAELRSVNLSIINKTTNLNLLKNMFTTRVEQLEKEGIHHVVIVAKDHLLDTIARCMNDKGLNRSYNIPVYSFSEGQEIEDKNLIDNFYVTREMLDNHLIRIMNSDTDSKFSKFKNKCHRSLELHQLKKRLHIPE